MTMAHDHSQHSHDIWQDVAGFLGADRYSEHSICLTNDPLIIAAYVASDLTIWLSYFVIGIALITKRRLIMSLSPDALLLFGAFIFFCGLSHATEILTMFFAVYRIDLAVSALTAGVSAVTAYYTVVALWGGAT